MPRNGSGVSSVVNTFVIDTVADPDEVNANFTDVADQLTNSLPRDGQAGMNAPLPLQNGTVALPALTFSSDANTGLYRKSADMVGIAAGGVEADYFASGSIYATKSGNYTALQADHKATHRYTAAATASLTAAATLGSNWKYTVIADGGAVTIDPNGSETINGLTTLIVPNGSSATIICDGSNFVMVFRPSGWQTIEQRSFSAASAVDFTNLGAYARLRLSGFISLSASGTLGWRSSTNNGSSYDSGASDYSFQGQTAIDTTLAGSRTTAASFGLLGGGGTSEVPEALFVNFNVSGQACVSVAKGTAFNGGGTTIFNRQDGAIRNDTTARNALRIFPTTAITITGTLLLEGSVS